MLNLRKVAVTGGVASGKSTVCRFFRELGAYVVNADEIVHKLLTPSTTLGQKVIALLGSEIVADGRIDRSRIAVQVFNDTELLKNLENLIHPEVGLEIEREYEKAKQSKAPLFVAEIPLLFEAGFEKNYEKVIVVDAEIHKARERFHKSDFFARMEKQMSLEQKKSHADYIIENNGSLGELQSKVKSLYLKLRSETIQ